MFLESTDCLAQCLEVFREFNAHNATANALLSLGRLCHATGDYDQAQLHFNESLHIARLHHFPLIEARIQSSIGKLLESRKDYDGAEAATQQARTILLRKLHLPEFSEN